MAARLRNRIGLREPAFAAMLLLAAIIGWHAGQFQHLTSDTFGLLDGVAVIDRCLHAHKWACGEAGYGGVGTVALLQYLPGLGFKRLGMTYDGAAHGLVWVNTVAVVLLLGLLWFTGRRVGDKRMAALLVLMAVASPLLWYSNAGFGEGLAALAVTAFTCAVVTRSNGVLLGVSLWLAAISKEPALPFLLALAFVVLRHPPPSGGPRLRRGQAVGLGLGTVAALATNIGFNAFRASEGAAAGARPLTSSIRHIAAPAPTLLQKAEAGVSLFTAPNVGLLWFWPVALGCLALGLIAAWQRSPSLRGFLDSPAAGSLIVFLLFAAGVSSFVAPYGFVAFGPRYLVPWVPSFALVALSDWESCSLLLDRLRARAKLAIPVAVAVLVLAVSQLAAFLNPLRSYAHFDPGGDCPTPLSDITTWYARYGEVHTYYSCTRYLAWTKTPVLAKVDAELGSPASLGYLVLYLAGTATLLAVALNVPLRRRAAAL
jgi:hypothetical protein